MSFLLPVRYKFLMKTTTTTTMMTTDDLSRFYCNNFFCTLCNFLFATNERKSYSIETGRKKLIWFLSHRTTIHIYVRYSLSFYFFKCFFFAVDSPMFSFHQDFNSMKMTPLLLVEWKERESERTNAYAKRFKLKLNSNFPANFLLNFANEIDRAANRNCDNQAYG